MLVLQELLDALSESRAWCRLPWMCTGSWWCASWARLLCRPCWSDVGQTSSVPATSGRPVALGSCPQHVHIAVSGVVTSGPRHLPGNAPCVLGLCPLCVIASMPESLLRHTVMFLLGPPCFVPQRSLRLSAQGLLLLASVACLHLAHRGQVRCISFAGAVHARVARSWSRRQMRRCVVFCSGVRLPCAP